MKKAIKILVLFLILSAANLPVSDSYMFDQESASGNFFSAGCWSPPTKPALVYPSDNYVADPNSAWKANPYMDWEDSVAQCPETAVHHYIYES